MTSQNFPEQVSDAIFDSPHVLQEVEYDNPGLPETRWHIEKQAIIRIHGFLQLDPTLVTKTPEGLAREMLGLETAVTALRRQDRMIENGEELRFSLDYIDGSTGLLVPARFFCGKMGSDFGTALMVRRVAEVEVDEPLEYVALPSDKYLQHTIMYGDPHEPVFYACETDIYSDSEWSSEQLEHLLNGGIAQRVFSAERAWHDDDGRFILDRDKRRTDVYRRDAVYYKPLYMGLAGSGCERYVQVTQELLRMFLRALDLRGDRAELGSLEFLRA